MRRFLLLVALTLPFAATADEGVTATDLVGRDDVVIALVDGEPVRLSDIGFQGQKVKILVQLEQAARLSLENHLFELLATRAAAGAGLDLEAWLRQEVDDKVAPVTELEARAFFEENPPHRDADFEAMKPRVIAYLERMRASEREIALYDELMAGHGVEVLLEPYRVQVSADDDPARGVSVAPVTVVMFFDFQCGYCDRARPTMDELLEHYPESVRVVYRDYPLESHPAAQRMAEAANCAHEQGRYFDYADALFANMRATLDTDLVARATEIGLDVTRFEECLSSGRYTAEVEADFVDGTAAGVTGTPAFYVNGRVISGAQPIEAFRKVVDEELGR